MATRVVIVDDHPLVREGLRGLIGDMDDVEVVGEAASVDDALAVIAATDPDLILLDLRLGEQDGHLVSRRLREDGSAVKILVLSAKDTTRDLREALRAGADGYLLKGGSAKSLAEGIQQAVAGATVIGHEFLPQLREDVARGAQPDAAITKAEQNVLELLAEGLSDHAIAEQLGITPRTVRRHVRSLYDKLQVDSRSHLMARAFREGLLR